MTYYVVFSKYFSNGKKEAFLQEYFYEKKPDDRQIKCKGYSVFTVYLTDRKQAENYVKFINTISL